MLLYQNANRILLYLCIYFLLKNVSETENSKKADHMREKVTRTSEAQDGHLCKRQRRDELQMPEYPTEVLHLF